MFERALFNAAQGARFPNGKALTYYSADERLWVRQNPPEGQGNWRYLYTAACYPSCCHDSGARAYPYAIAAMWMRSRDGKSDGLAATLYGPSHMATRINGVPVEIAEKTGYPFSFDIEFSIVTKREIKFPLRLRVPIWSDTPTVTAAGAGVIRDENGFMVVTKKWKNGDRIRLSLKPAIRGKTAANGTAALTYGPLVFSLPIPERAEITQRFPQAEKAGLTGFYGYQYDPEDLAYAKRPLSLQRGKPSYGFKLLKDPAADFLHPWEHPPLKLRGKMSGAAGKMETVGLVPMGSTILRRTCFPTGR